MKKAVAMLTTIFFTAAVMWGGILYFYFSNFSTKDGKDLKNKVEAKEVKGDQPINVLVLGVDIGVAGSEDSPKRSDTMMVVHYDPKTSQTAVISIPRDTRVKIKGSYEKINAANAFGGPELAISTVEDLIGISINYYVEINYEAFRKLVDAVGGIDIVVPYNMDYDDNAQDLHIHFKKGQNVHLNGTKAEQFVRWRKNNDGSGYIDGDLGRVKTQQDFVVKLVDKIKSPAIIPKIPSIIKILYDNIDTNMDLKAIANLSKDIPKIKVDSIQKFTLPGESKTIDGLSYFVYDPQKNSEMVDMLQGKKTAAEKNGIKVQVLNGSGIDGAAASVKQYLEGRGYTVTGVGNVSGVKFKSSHIIDKTLKGTNAKQVASEFDISDIEKDQDSLSGSDIILILGYDIDKFIN